MPGGIAAGRGAELPEQPPRTIAKTIVNPAGISADTSDIVAERDAIAPDPNEVRRGQLPDETAAASEATLLVTPDRDFQGMSVRIVPLLKRVSHLDGRHRAHVAVVVTTAGHRIDVGAEQNRWCVPDRPFSTTEYVPHRVDANFQSGRTHQIHGEGAAFDVGLREGDPAHASLEVASEP